MHVHRVSSTYQYVTHRRRRCRRRRHHLLHISLATSATVLPNSPYPKTQSEPERKRNKRTFPTHTRGYSQGLNRNLEESPVAGSEVRVQGRARHPSAV